MWSLLLIAAGVGAVLGLVLWVVVVPRVAAVVGQTPGPELPDHLAPGWYAQCAACGRTRTLASVGGIRLGANRNAHKATLGWCRACRRLRIIRVVHADRLGLDSED